MPSYDVMPDVQLYQPAEVDDALNLADRYKDDGWILGGGQEPGEVVQHPDRPRQEPGSAD